MGKWDTALKNRYMCSTLKSMVFEPFKRGREGGEAETYGGNEERARSLLPIPSPPFSPTFLLPCPFPV